LFAPGEDVILSRRSWVAVRGEDGRSPLLMIFGISVAIAAVLAIVAWVMHARLARPVVRPPLSADAQAYLKQIAVTDIHMSAAETGLGSNVTYLDAQVTNDGARPVREVDLDLTFVDMVSQMVLRRTVHAVTRTSPPLKPGESRPFRATFDYMPTDWNQGPPNVTVTYVSF
jgi:type VI protein secretion system component VasK